MALSKKTKTYRRKKADSDEEESPAATEIPQDISSTIEELNELRKLRRKPGGIDTERLLKGADKKKKKKKADAESSGWNLKEGGLVDSGSYRAKMDEEDTTKAKKLTLDTFTTQTNTLDVDKHMMEYIETEMRKRRGGAAQQDDEDEDDKNDNRGLVDIYEELYRIPDRLKGEQKPVQEGNVQLSTQMLTAIPEVDLGIDTRLKNIEDTEKAKRKLIDNTQREEQEAASRRRNEVVDELPANYEKQIPKQYRPRLNQKLMATDEQVAERFKKRMRK